ncbi:MAG TPA: hypothetical protein VGF73_11900 [Chthoniobacterales bacterium]
MTAKTSLIHSSGMKGASQKMPNGKPKIAPTIVPFRIDQARGCRREMMKMPVLTIPIA